jgi:hypothetical protein
MAVRTYGVVLADVLALLPVNTTRISATSKLSTTHITGYIEDGAGRITAALKRAGVDPDSLDDDTTAQVKRALEHYVVAACLAKLGRTSSTAYTEAKAAYEEALTRFESSGSSLAAQPTSIKTTVDTSPIVDTRGFFTGGKSIW